jgi:hypothetical protein
MSVAKSPVILGRTDAGADLTMLAGTWTNTNERTRGIVGMKASIDSGILMVNLFGAGDGASIDWGAVPATVYHLRNDEGLEQPFLASYDFGFMDVVLQGFLRQGVLVILSFTRFRDGSGRASYFSKEFFYRIAE